MAHYSFATYVVQGTSGNLLHVSLANPLDSSRIIEIDKVTIGVYNTDKDTLGVPIFGSRVVPPKSGGNLIGPEFYGRLNTYMHSPRAIIRTNTNALILSNLFIVPRHNMEDLTGAQTPPQWSFFDHETHCILQEDEAFAITTEIDQSPYCVMCVTIFWKELLGMERYPGPAEPSAHLKP